MRLTKVTHAIAHALNILNGVENSNACSSASDSDPSGFTFNIATKTLAFIEDCKSFTALWYVNHKYYTNQIKRNGALNAWQQIIKSV